MFEKQVEGYWARPNNLTFLNSDYEFCCVTPDAFLAPWESRDIEILEIKTTTANHELYKNGSLPNSHLIQLNYQMGVLGIKKGRVATMLSGDPNLIDNPLDFDQELFDYTIKACAEFYECLKSGKAPLPDSADTKAIDELLKIEKGKTITVDNPSLIQKVEALIAVEQLMSEPKASLSELEKSQNELRNEVKLILKDYDAQNYIIPVASDTNYQIKLTKVEIAEKISKAYSYVKFSMKEV